MVHTSAVGSWQENNLSPKVKEIWGVKVEIQKCFFIALDTISSIKGKIGM